MQVLLRNSSRPAIAPALEQFGIFPKAEADAEVEDAHVLNFSRLYLVYTQIL
jgi:hypothetical protein